MPMEEKSDPAGIRTLDTQIKSLVLYQLSYGTIFKIAQIFWQPAFFQKAELSYGTIFKIAQIFWQPAFFQKAELSYGPSLLIKNFFKRDFIMVSLRHFYNLFYSN
jgi:hypothetical protein